MDGGILDSDAIASWAPVVAAYIFGIATGWLIWGGAGPAEAKSTEVETPPAQTLAAASSDIASADDGVPASSNKGSGGEGSGESGADVIADAVAREKLGRLQTELRDARALLARYQKEQTDFGKDLSVVDKAIARANGRLKVLMRSAQRAGAARDADG